MDRSAHKLGIAIIKEEINSLAAQQKAQKKILRMPRKNDDDIKAIKEALDEIDRYAHWKTFSRIGNLQWECLRMKMRITAYLNVYAEIRGKLPVHSIKSYDLSAYKQYLDEAQKHFEAATTAMASA